MSKTKYKKYLIDCAKRGIYPLLKAKGSTNYVNIELAKKIFKDEHEYLRRLYEKK